MEVVKFVINRTPYACWDWDLKEKNLEFLEGIDAGYFNYIVNSNSGHLESDDKHRAALSLRLAYSHGLETLFALLCSAVQSPHCAVGWVLNYRITDLVNLVRNISEKEPIYSRFKQTPMTWELLAKCIHSGLSYEESKRMWIQKGFGRLWKLFASEFVNENFSQEYNSMKHGLRVQPGGFDFAVGYEDTPGIPAPPEKMMSLGSSDFGSSYFVKEYIDPKDKSNFRPRRHSYNWSPYNLSNGLFLISMSINNVVSWLRGVNGVPMRKCRFENPVSEDLFEEPWKDNLGVDHASLDRVIVVEHITPFSNEDILRTYKELD